MSQITILTPLAGTRLYERFKHENRLLRNDWSNYTFTEVNFIPKQLSIEQLKNGIFKIYKEIYSPKARFKVLKHFKDNFVIIAIRFEYIAINDGGYPSFF